MIELISTHKELSKFISDICSENNICVTFDAEINKNDYVIIKVDQYYNSLKLNHTPASPDCLIVRRCHNGGYGITIVELKNIHTSSAFTIENMKEKFETCFRDFIESRFQDILYIEYKDVKLYFVSEIEIYKRDLGLKLEVLINIQFAFNGKVYMIQPRMPTPTIKKCY